MALISSTEVLVNKESKITNIHSNYRSTDNCIYRDLPYLLQFEFLHPSVLVWSDGYTFDSRFWLDGTAISPRAARFLFARAVASGLASARTVLARVTTIEEVGLVGTDNPD